MRWNFRADSSGTRGDAGGFDGIGIRWIARYMKDHGLQSSYLSWLQANANAAWNRRRTDNLSWSRWNEQTPVGTQTSFDLSSSVVAQIGRASCRERVEIS